VARSPFSKKTTSPSVANEARLAATLSNNEAAILERAARRQDINFDLVSLEIRNRTRTKDFERSFVSVARKHPHHEFLIKQLLHGAQLDLGNRLVSFQTHQDCYYGIEEFINYLNSQDHPHHKQISCIADIDFQVTRNFVAHFLQLFPGRTVNRKRYGRVRSVVDILQRKFGKNPSVGNSIVWAQAPATNDTPSESYSDEVFNQLIEACITDIKSIMKMMATYPEQLDAAKRTLANFRYTVQDNGLITGAARNETNILCSALTARARPDWPLLTSLEDANQTFSTEWYQSLCKSEKEMRNIYRVLIRMKILHEIRHQRDGEMRTISLEVGQMAYMCQFFFTIQTIFPFILFVQLNTGWNLEAVLSLTDDLASHIGEDLVNPDQYVLIYGTKLRTKDVLYCRSNKKHPYSGYNIHQFVQRRVLIFKESQHYQSGRLWQGILSKNLWMKFDRIVVSVDAPKYLEASRSFLRRHGFDIGTVTKQPSIESRRIRTTWETKRREQGLSIETVSKMMGHSEVGTTVLHYDSDTGSARLHHKKLRQLQVEWDNDFRNYGVKLSVSTTLAQLREAIGTPSQHNTVSRTGRELGDLDEESVIHLLSPEGQTYIAACLDPRSPSWPGAERFVSSDERCSYFNRCCMCKQAVIFKESLPYVVRRISDLTALKTRINSIEWSSNYGEEATAWEQILELWDPSSDVEEAKSCAESPRYSLPLTMRGAR